MIRIQPVSRAEFDAAADAAHITLPIEQTQAWTDYQATISGRTPWVPTLPDGTKAPSNCFLIQRVDDSADSATGEPANDSAETIAFIAFVDFETHGYHFLRSSHGPVYISEPSDEEASEVIDALADFAKSVDKKLVFLRFAIKDPLPQTHTVLSTVPYDQTVVIDVTGGDDAILQRMKSRGRRDVRKALRECPAVCADETIAAMESFADYYGVMVETGERDGFTPAPMSDYEDMIRTLGAEHCRVFAARVDGVVNAWSIVTVNGTHAVRYYAAMRSGAMRLHITDRLLYAECCELGKQGMTEYDLMGIGDDFAPSLKGLNEFKTKFTPEITKVAPNRDVPLRKMFYNTLTAAKKIKG